MAKKEKKVAQTRNAGYVPFTREDLNQHSEERNSKAVELFLELLDIPKRVIKKKKKGQEIIDDDFYPTSMEETLKMEAKLAQVESAITDRSDTELMEHVSWMKETLVWSKTRQWAFAWWIVIAVFAMSMYYFHQTKKEARVRDSAKAWTVQVSEDKRQEAILRSEQTLERQKDYLAAAEDKVTIKSYQKSIKETEKELQKLQKMSADDYKKYWMKQYNRWVWNKRWSALWCLFWIGLYILALRPYGYMVSKRRTEMKIYGGLQKALFGVAGALFGAAASLKVTEYITTYSDGSKERSNDAMVILAIQLVLMAAAVFLILFVARIVIVVASIMGLFRNYELIPRLKKAIADHKGKKQNLQAA